MEQKINAEFITEKASWDSKSNNYVDRCKTVEFKEIAMRIEEREGRKILRFIGGPTGFESYYLDDLISGGLMNFDGGKFCICGGTVNSWPRCQVCVRDVQDFIKLTEVKVSCEKQCNY